MRIITLLIILLFYLNAAYGQSILGFAAGGHYTVIPYTPYFHVADVDPKFSYIAGTYFAAPAYKNLYYSLGVNYNHFVAHLIGHESSASHSRVEDINLSLGFISLNVMPQYSFGKKRNFYIKAGGYFSLLVNSEEVGTYEVRVVNGDHHSGKIDHDARNDYKDIDFGLAFNTGIRLKFDEISWFVTEIGYNLGLYKYNQTGSNIQDIHKSGFKSAYFLLGFDINLGHK